MTDIPFNITREEVLNLAAAKLTDAFADDGELSNIAERNIRERVEQKIGKGLELRIDQFLSAEMEKLMSKEIVPVDIWGENTGKATTIKAELHRRAREFWDVRVDSDGKPSGSYGGEPRHVHLMKQIVKEEYSKAIKENAEEIVLAFKAALKADAARISSEHIDKLINIKPR
jgi:hypothetical protein